MNEFRNIFRSYGFVDFVSSYSARECHGQRTQLIPPEPGQVGHMKFKKHLVSPNRFVFSTFVLENISHTC